MLRRLVISRPVLSAHTRVLSSIPPSRSQKLSDDVKYLGATLGEAIKTEDKTVFEAVEKLRRLGREWRVSDKSKFEEMVKEVKSYDTKKLSNVGKAFTHFLALSNTAENHHRLRRLREYMLDNTVNTGLSTKEDTALGTIRRLVNVNKMSADDVIAALTSQSVEIVLTAHPTEVNRRTMLRKQQRIQTVLEQQDRLDLTQYERRQLDRQLKEEVMSIWNSDALNRTKPVPQKEASGGLAIVENVLWHSVPKYLRKLDDALKLEFGKAIPLTVSPIKIASWMGGDRDGNPNVTPEITLEVCAMSRWTAASLFSKDIKILKNSLSFKTASKELSDSTNGHREPYKVLLKLMEARLDATMRSSAAGIIRESWRPLSDSISDQPYQVKADLMDPLMMIHRSLVETGFGSAADGVLSDTIRRLAVFGLTLMQLDIRQESTRHTEALTAITTQLGLGTYSEWDESKRREWLASELSSKRPLLPRGQSLKSMGFSPTVLDTLRTFEAAANLGPESLGAYVISQCQQASDVMAVLLLQQDAGVKPALRVVPLFETLEDLENSPATVEALFSIDAYTSRIQGKQEIMVGYSDSAKDAGRLAASWAQYNAQEAMAACAERHKIEVTFFHGKGGTVGRGGNPAVYAAILAHPPHTINGRFRVTEQGEMITQNLGQEGMAEKTLDLFTAGVLAERFVDRPEPKKEWREAMERLSKVSCAAYRQVVREEPRFVPYFRSATPELELSGLNVGSRPAKRNPKGGVESLRAIPWVFAWTQTRLNLPAWLGVGAGLEQEFKTNPEVLKEMYQDWPWFRTIIDLVEMILSKSESDIAANYDKQLVNDEQSLALGRELRALLEGTTQSVLAITGHTVLQENNPNLLRSMLVRNPYVDPLNVIQAELLQRIRKDGNEEDPVLRDALLITINGIANGMRNSG
mmetsp:Transcript_14188/g.13713  ORF Transcript_14188/g.13713 Transcript_14188/m.13713 type:complete len:921 (+) Transcript_14188:137-2899(+)|eukprot:CAMPEP_0119051646 /NCGR_PEP_ID=MMETSP1177-20130426/73192_1 /TAXON_ID=2985 /ORGANISM="Ochromonas sp, Strain CCMP1899" /LENGTH=920 /DNA_ID=CAMNT_0007030921 /DNA_START=135 /DNA_END=2897 /DNA_ORIENTATION=-